MSRAFYHARMGVVRTILRLAALAAIPLAGCSGGGSSPAAQQMLPTPPPGSANVTNSAALSTSSATVIAVPALGGYAATLTFGTLDANQAPAVVSVAGSLTPPVTSTATFTITLSLKPAATQQITPLYYVTVTPSATVSVDGIRSIAITLPASIAPAAVYSIATTFTSGFFSGTTAPAWSAWAGPMPPSNGAVTFLGSSAPQTFYNGQPVTYALYAGGPPP